MTFVTYVDFQRVGPAGKLTQPDAAKRSLTFETQAVPGQSALTDMLSGAARKVAPSLKNLPIRIRMTTPDGCGSYNPCFFIESKGTGARYGYGFIRVISKETQERVMVYPWSES